MKDYQQLIIDHVKEKLDTRSNAWRILFPDGFKPGLNIIPVVTNDGVPRRLIAELHFSLSEDLNLDIDDIEIVHRDQPWQPSMDYKLGDSLDLLNDIIVSLNEFIRGLKLNQPEKQLNLFPASPVVESDLGINRIESSVFLPSWFKQISDAEVKDKLLRKLSSAYEQYKKTSSGDVTLESFFARYTEHLQRQGHLYHYCTYKGKPMEVTDEGHCTESYCSKKPYDAPCPHSVLKFGKE